MRKYAKAAISIVLLCTLLLSVLPVIQASEGESAVRLIDYTSFTRKRAGHIKLTVADYKTMPDRIELTLDYSVNASLNDHGIVKGFIRADKVLQDRFEKDVLKAEPFDLSALQTAAAAEVTVSADAANMTDGTYFIYSGFYDAAGNPIEGLLEGWYTRYNETLIGTLLVEGGVVCFYPVDDAVAGNPAEAAYVVYAFKGENKPTVDGDISEWGTQMFGFAAGLSAADPDDFSTKIAVSWDDEYLYFIEDRTDNKLFFDDEISRDLYQADNLRIYLSTSNTYANRNAFDETDYVICINPRLGKEGGALIRNDAYGGANMQYDVSAVQTAYRQKPGGTGFTAEIAIPFSLFRITPHKDMEFGFQMIADDSDESGVRAGSYNYISRLIGAYWESPAGMARLILNEGSIDNSLVLQTEAEKSSYDSGDIINLYTNMFYSVPLDGTNGVVLDYGDEKKEYTIPANMKRYNKFFASVPAEKNGKVSLYTVVRPEDGSVCESNRVSVGILKRMTPAEIDDDLGMVVSKGDTILPSLKQTQYVNSITEKDGAFILSYQDDKEKIEYRYVPVRGESSEISILLNGEEFYTPAGVSGIRHMTEEGVKFPDEMDVKVVKAEKTEKGVEVTFSYAHSESGFTAQADYILSISGKTLVLEMSTNAPAVGYTGGFTGFGDLVDEIAYLPDYINLRLGGNIFFSSYFDWRYGNHTAMSREGVTYNPLTDGSYNDFRERYMITLSSDVTEVFPNFNNGISPYRDEVAEKIMMDIWGYPVHNLSSFSKMGEYAKELKSYGMDDVIFIRHEWQRDGYDMTIPDTLPAYAPNGGDEALIPAGKLMSDFGWRFGVHTNYTDYSPVYKDYTDEHAILNTSGNVRPGGTFGGILNNFIKPTFYDHYINIFEPEITKRYSTNMSFVDVFGARTPQRDVDYDATQEGAGMERFVFEKTEEAINQLRAIHDGPFFSEGGSDHARYAGIIDGVEAQGAPLYMLPDFDLTKIFPLSLNHGMGYYAREVRGGSDGLYTRDVTDWYRARQIAYGHQAYVMDQMPATMVTQVLSEYYLMRAAQLQYAASRVKNIWYLKGEERLSLGDALREGYFDSGKYDRIEVIYENGTKVVVNCQEDSMYVDGYELPQNGFYVENKQNGYLALGGTRFDGKWADMSVGKDEVFFSARNNQSFFGVYDIQPQLTDVSFVRPADQNSNGSIEFTFDWNIGEPLPDGSNFIIMHIYTDNIPGIAIVADNTLPSDMAEAIGSYEYKRTIDLPDNLLYDQWYNIGTTLYDGVNRFRLSGRVNTDNLVYSGRMKFVKEGEETKVIMEPYIVGPKENTPGDMVDFGKVAANNQFVAKRERGGWNLTVHPREAALNLVLEDADIKRIVALNGDGKSIGEIGFTTSERGAEITLDNDEAASFLIQGEITWK